MASPGEAGRAPFQAWVGLMEATAVRAVCKGTIKSANSGENTWDVPTVDVRGLPVLVRGWTVVLRG